MDPAFGATDGSAFVVRSETPDQPDVRALLEQADERSAALYPEDNRHGLTLAELLAADIRFFVARQGDRAVGCGGYALISDGIAEIKRLFVDPGARTKGLGGLLVRTIESAAAEEGVVTLLLETGIKSDEALQLYQRLGYVECGPFAAYHPDPLSVFMAKQLTASSRPFDTEELHRLELQLLSPSGRQSASVVDQLLAADFIEIGRSGLMYGKAETMAGLAEEATTAGAPTRDMHDFRVIQLADDVALAIYRVRRNYPDGRVSNSLRSSIWTRADQSWRMIFHQGTPSD